MGARELSPAYSTTLLHSLECEAGVRGREERQCPRRRSGEKWPLGEDGGEGHPGALASEHSRSPAGDPGNIPEVPQASFPPV